VTTTDPDHGQADQVDQTLPALHPQQHGARPVQRPDRGHQHPSAGSHQAPCLFGSATLVARLSHH
jgi:hypothetical protein